MRRHINQNVLIQDLDERPHRLLGDKRVKKDRAWDGSIKNRAEGKNQLT